MPILTMETQTNVEMAPKEAHEEKSKDQTEEMSEREFLRDLYIFMKKRDTPIERIPNLGFKQIDLYMMYITVKDLGGYHQVTAQQMWKQVYNMLGGNPRSTSAATCTRRHYEKLLLPYECNKKGIPITLLPQHQPKPFPFASFCKEDGDGQKPAKRRLLSMHVQQSKQNLESDPRRRVFSIPLQYSPFCLPSHTVQTPHVPISPPVLTPYTPPAPQPWFTYNPSPPNQTEKAKEPLELLRSLAEQYKTSSGLASEPLNLSVKESTNDTNSSPVSSFTPPSLSKNPKFLNKPSTLYTPQSPQVRNEGSDPSQENEAGLENKPLSCAWKEREAYFVDVKAVATSSNPRYIQTLTTSEESATLVQKPSLPQVDFTVNPKEDEERYSDATGYNLAQILPNLTQKNGRRMEIEIPLSTFNNWLRLCGSTGTMQGLKQLTMPPFMEVQSHRSDADVQPTNLTFQTSNQLKTPVAEDLSIRKRSLPSPTAPAVHTTVPPLIAIQNSFTSYKHLPPGGILKNAASRDVFPFDSQEFQKSYTSKSLDPWNHFGNDTPATSIHMKTDSHNPLAIQHDLTGSAPFDDDVILVGNEKQERAPSGLVMLGAGSTSLLQLTPEEVLKLKKIISSS